MAPVTRLSQRFFFTGICDFPPDALPPGKLPYGRNIRSYQDGIITPRNGLTPVIDAAVGSSVHSLGRLNDPTPFNGSVPSLRIFGAGDSLYVGDPSGSSYSSLDSGYSGNPLTFCTAQPPRSPRPYCYVSDPSRQRKFLTDGSAVPTGIAQPSAPSTEPTAAVEQLSTRTVVEDVSWQAAGTYATDPTPVLRMQSPISLILYDSGSTGYCSIVLEDFTNVEVGMVVQVDPVGDFVPITDLTIAVADTTVEAIIYDSGTTGLCTIQPSGSLGTGQINAPNFWEYTRRYQRQTGVNYAVPRNQAGLSNDLVDTAGSGRQIRQMDFPVNCLVTLNGAETVRILSVAVGPDGRQSFRCSTATTISVGDTIEGLPAIRMYLPDTHVPGQLVTNNRCVGFDLSFPELMDGSTTDVTTTNGGIQTATAVNFAQFSDGRAVLPDDILHFAIKVDKMTEVMAIRLYLDVDATTNDFLANYYVYEWRASDIITAIQGTNTAIVATISDARATVVANQQLDGVPFGGIGGAWDWLRGRGIVASSTSADGRTGAQRRTGALASQTAADAATSEQLALGNNQWIDLKVRVGDLIRVGTDSTRTLANVGAIEILVQAQVIGIVNGSVITPEPLAIQAGDVYCAGGAGPDVGDVGDPYVYRYRYRASSTGVVSNPSPATRGGVIPHRQGVLLTGTPSDHPECDKIDWFRFGATLTEWSYVGTGENSSDPYEDLLPDSAVVGGEVLAFDMFQPWATQDLPRAGTCNVAGSAVQRASGDAFDTSWAPGSPLIINGRIGTLYASPASEDLLFVNENLLSGDAVPFAVPGATKLSQNLRSFWGDYQNIWFGCGDPDNPGTLYWTHGNNPEACSDAYTLQVTPPSDPLQGGGVYNVFPFVFSCEDLFELQVRQTDTGPQIVAGRTPCGRGLWTPWSFAVGVEGIYFLSGDGIYVTAGGSPAKSITDPDLRAIFPRDGIGGHTISSIVPPDMTQTTRLRLSYIAGYLYFDYLGTDGNDYTLIYDTDAGRWALDDSELTGIVVRDEEPGDDVFNQILGGLDGKLYRYDENAILDDTTDLQWAIWTPLVDAGAPRVVKQFADCALSVAPNGSVNGLTVRPVANDTTIVLDPEVIGAGDTDRATYILDLNAGDGQWARNLGLRISGTLTDGDTARPALFLWEPSFIPKSDDVERRATDWDALGYLGAKFVQGVVIRANTYGQDKTIVIQSDGAVDQITLTINHDGELTKEYPSAPSATPGWEPFISHMVRIIGGDDVQWNFLEARFVWEPAPELATEWKTQYTSHDLPGYFSIRDAVIAHESESNIRFRVIYDDGVTTDYTIPASGVGVYKRTYLPLVARKGIAVQYELRAGCPFRLYKRDCSIRVGPWGGTSGYLQATPFGGPHRASGAEI